MSTGPTIPVQHGRFMYFELHPRAGPLDGRGRFVSVMDSLSQAASANSATAPQPHHVAQPLRSWAGRGFSAASIAL